MTHSLVLLVKLEISEPTTLENCNFDWDFFQTLTADIFMRNPIESHGIIQFFMFYSSFFRQSSKDFQEIRAVEIVPIGDDFNTKWGFHGHNGKAFLFHVILNDGTADAVHFCLGYGRGCSHGCRADNFGVD